MYKEKWMFSFTPKLYYLLKLCFSILCNLVCKKKKKEKKHKIKINKQTVKSVKKNIFK